MTAAKSQPVGSVWTVPAADGDRVVVVRPDESESTYVAGPDGALVVLDAPGKYASGEHTATAKG